MEKKHLIFKSAKAYRSALSDYIIFCEGAHRLANAAGFCAFCRIGRRQFTALREEYGDEFDIMSAMLLDEALNSKIANSGAIMEYIEALPNSLCKEEEGELRVICGHDASADGQ